MQFNRIIERSKNPASAAMLLVLGWIASSDGTISNEEMKELVFLSQRIGEPDDIHAIIHLCTKCQVDDIQIACEILRRLEPSHRSATLKMAVLIALCDGHITTAEGHILRFLADVLQHSPADLDSLFFEVADAEFPAPGDPSSIEWWDSRESQSRARTGTNQGESRSDSQSRSGASNGQRLRDLGILGLDETATISEIRDAYRRMAQIHHPDKFATLGPEAVKAAEATFERIHTAFQRLVRE